MALPLNSRDGTSHAGASHAGGRPSPRATGDEGISDLQLRWRETLVLWLRWNQAYEHVAEQMLQAGHDSARLEQLMDQMDELRRKAVAQSHQLLD
jgi:methylphosphotriester-DNA--protein-cysteine methyltransferase